MPRLALDAAFFFNCTFIHFNRITPKSPPK